MALPQAVSIGVFANKLSKKIVGDSQPSVARSVVATGAGAVGGAIATGAVVVGAGLVGVAAAPITVPLAVAAGGVAFIASLFD